MSKTTKPPFSIRANLPEKRGNETAVKQVLLIGYQMDGLAFAVKNMLEHHKRDAVISVADPSVSNGLEILKNQKFDAICINGFLHLAVSYHAPGRIAKFDQEEGKIVFEALRAGDFGPLNQKTTVFNMSRSSAVVFGDDRINRHNLADLTELTKISDPAPK